MPNKPDRDDALLEDFFAAARASAPQPPGALLARVMEDAGAVLAAKAVPAADASPAGGGMGGWFGRLFEMLGGWSAVGGLATASFAGLWLGLSGAAGLPGGAVQWPAVIGGASLDVMPDTYSLLSQVSEE